MDPNELISPPESDAASEPHMGDESYGADGGGAPAWRDAGWRRWSIVGLIAALVVGKLAHGLMIGAELEQTAALYIGLPALMAGVVVLCVRTRSVTGTILVAITVGLLLSAIVFGEGWICILMASPLFYLVGAVIGVIFDWARASNPYKTQRYGALLLPLVLLASTEGTLPRLTFAREARVTVARVVAASPDEVAAALAGPPRFERPLPRFLGLGFPAPIRGEGRGLAVGAVRRIAFAGGSGEPAAVEAIVTRSEPGRVEFAIQGDRTPIAGWLRWRTSEVTWRAAGPNRTLVEWTLAYERRLDPAWYFGPWQRYAVGLSAHYMIESAATP